MVVCKEVSTKSLDHFNENRQGTWQTRSIFVSLWEGSSLALKNNSVVPTFGGRAEPGTQKD